MEDDSLYNAIIISLVIGIIIVIATLIFLRPEPEYFTELYYTNHTELPKYIEANKLHIFDITIHNHEEKNTTYPIKITAEYENRTEVIDEFTATIEKDKKQEIHVQYRLNDFYRAKIKTQVNSQDIHFFVYNSEEVVEYPDAIASITCLKEPIPAKADSFTIFARGEAEPNMKVRIDGEEIFQTTIHNKEFMPFEIREPTGTYLDIIFDNDGKNNGTDINLYIQKLQIGNITIAPSQGILDTGSMFDCENLKTTTNHKWNSALRFKFT